MAMKPSLQVRLSQHLALTPQLQQSIRLLQLSTLELQQEVGQMLEQNPFLEVEEEGASPFESPLERPAADRAEEADDAEDATIETGQWPPPSTSPQMRPHHCICGENVIGRVQPARLYSSMETFY